MIYDFIYVVLYRGRVKMTNDTTDGANLKLPE